MLSELGMGIALRWDAGELPSMTPQAVHSPHQKGSKQADLGRSHRQKNCPARRERRGSRKRCSSKCSARWLPTHGSSARQSDLWRRRRRTGFDRDVNEARSEFEQTGLSSRKLSSV